MRAAGVDAPVSTIVQQHTCEAEDGLKQLPVAIRIEACRPKGFRVPITSFAAIFEVLGTVEEEVAGEILNLRALIETVGGDETLEDVVEPIQERDPVE